jgi:HAMP domain-containing protein/uncharacterized ParB-like nuclease family protein
MQIEKIQTTGTQSRVSVDTKTVDEYADALQSGATLPPVTVFFDGTNYWLADGFHRLAAHRRLNRREIEVEQRDGTQRDAILHSVGANASHGLRRSNADKRRAVEMLLSDPEWSQWSDNAIAKACRVSHTFVAQSRPHLETLQDSQPRKVERNGTVYEQKTANIGRSAQPEPAPQPAPANDAPPWDDAPPPLTEMESLEQSLREVTDSLEDALAALADLNNPNQKEYMSEIGKLRAELRAVETTRDALQNENAALKRHIRMLEKKLK